jgi:DNA repair protein RadC
MYEQLPLRLTTIPSNLRRRYGIRLVKEPLRSLDRVQHLTPLRSPRDVFAFMQPFADQEAAETFWALPLNSQHCCPAPFVITRGILNSSLVHPREVFRAMVAANAAAVVLCHNHPSGDPTPSADDRHVTTQLVSAGILLDIPVHDHVIIGDGRYCSFAEAGLL